MNIYIYKYIEYIYIYVYIYIYTYRYMYISTYMCVYCENTFFTNRSSIQYRSIEIFCPLGHILV